MNTVEGIFEEIRNLPEFQAREVLDFVGYLKAKRAAADNAVFAPQTEESDWIEFEKLAGAWSGDFKREECYDRPILR